ncbi:hypothetical protein ACIQUY_32575 [Streptomyces sp. NPDC090231]|uniref:hypothetical protein n=1 Tax=unclassified Streptomyces TaxID=2593676 RepID=UPI0038194CD4
MKVLARGLVVTAALTGALFTAAGVSAADNIGWPVAPAGNTVAGDIGWPVAPGDAAPAGNIGWPNAAA